MTQTPASEERAAGQNVRAGAESNAPAARDDIDGFAPPWTPRAARPGAFAFHR